MNNIDRKLVKSQARDLIKGKVFQLFLIILIVSILTGGLANGINLVYNLGNDSQYTDFNFDKNNHSAESDEDYFSNFNFENPIEDFEFHSQNSISEIADYFQTAKININFTSEIVCIVFIPLYITMTALFVAFVRRNPNEEFRLGVMIENLFKNSFSKNYGKRLLTGLLRECICALLMCLFIVPGVIAYYSTYFTYQILCDFPNLSPVEAIKLSKKMITGHRTELFVMNLSFIGWYLLYPVTLGFIGIYVEPYKYTTDDLYYENFRLRAIETGVLTEDDFLSDAERAAKYAPPSGYNQPNYNPNNGNFNAQPPYQQSQQQSTQQPYSYRPEQYTQPENPNYYYSPYEKPDFTENKTDPGENETNQ